MKPHEKQSTGVLMSWIYGLNSVNSLKGEINANKDILEPPRAFNEEISTECIDDNGKKVLIRVF
jgi:hypothetical protein